MKKKIKMKQHSIVFSLALVFCLFSSTLVLGQTVEKSRQLSRSFLLGENTEIEISNKYGNIHLVNWEKDSVRFDIELIVKGPKQSKVDKTFDFIDFEFQSTKYYIIAQTNFEGSSFWNDVGDLTGTIFSSNTKTKIDYTVYLPKNASLKVLNKYGNIYTTNHSGEITIELSNGDLKAHHLSGKTNIKSDFGNCNIHRVDNGNMNINYSEFYLEEGGILDIESKSTEFHINDIDELQINSKRDKYFLKRVDSFKGNSYFSRINIEKLEKQIDFSTKYGDVEINQFAHKLSSFNVTTINTDLILHFGKDRQYTLDITVDEETKVYYSSEITNIKSMDKEGEEKLIKVDCIIGEDKTKMIPFTISCRGGTMSLKMK